MIWRPKNWSELPPAIRRLAWWWVPPLFLMIAGATWYALADGASILARMLTRPWSGVMIPLAINFPIFVSIAAIAWSLRRIRIAYAASAGCLCTNCLHDLQGLGTRGRCPECGSSFDTDLDRAAWRKSQITPKD